ncbi:MAG TPA: 1,2-phenylacetyl-CoA epoxidase subunit PaaC [Roseiflexaceae bacterium]|nr:1,2-phenylacetyl-CoA epoxidase subunit PaaC [Roseiflexaceae bacterium]
MKDKPSTNDTESSVLSPQSLALPELLLALADDEFVIGYANSEWTGIAPLLEEDIAFSSLAQDELGHARLLYELVVDIEGMGDGGWGFAFTSAIPYPSSPDTLAYGREPSGYRHARLVERPRGDWAYSVSRQLLYDTADYTRLESLCRSAYQPLAQATASIIREEKYHLLHAHTWLERLACGGGEARARQRAAFEELWPDALGIFEPLADEAALVEAGILPASFAALRDRWLSSLAEPMRRLELPFPFVERGSSWQLLIAPDYGGRRGEHSASFMRLYEQITSVYRLDPDARW